MLTFISKRTRCDCWALTTKRTLVRCLLIDTSKAAVTHFTPHAYSKAPARNSNQDQDQV